MALASGRPEAADAPWRFGQLVGFGKDGLDAFHDAQLGDAVAGRDGLGLGGKIGHHDAQLTTVAGVDDAGEGGDAAHGEA